MQQSSVLSCLCLSVSCVLQLTGHRETQMCDALDKFLLTLQEI